jgi:hypothetical protein
LSQHEQAWVCSGVHPLLIEFSDGNATASPDGDGIVVGVDGETYELTREAAVDLRESLADALTERREFFRTAGEFRADGSYVVSRKAADSAGNAKVFDSFDALGRLYGRLPERFDADDVGRTGITGSRRHMVIRHFAEHPAFECRIRRRNPLSAEKVECGPAAEEVTEAEE